MLITTIQYRHYQRHLEISCCLVPASRWYYYQRLCGFAEVSVLSGLLQVLMVSVPHLGLPRPRNSSKQTNSGAMAGISERHGTGQHLVDNYRHREPFLGPGSREVRCHRTRKLIRDWKLCWGSPASQGYSVTCWSLRSPLRRKFGYCSPLQSNDRNAATLP